MRNSWTPELPKPLEHDRNKIQIDEHRYVILYKVHGEESDILDAARICYDGDGKVSTTEKDQSLINHLLRNMHTSPFEQPAMVFKVSVDMPTATQMLRHRMAKVNGVSARYVVMKPRYYIPKEWRFQNKTGNMQQGFTSSNDARGSFASEILEDSTEGTRVGYDYIIDVGIEQGQARLVLTQNQVTQYVYQMDINNLMRFLFLRNDHHAQKEIREIAAAMLYFFSREFPMCYAAWLEYIWRQSKFGGRATLVLRQMLRDLTSHENGIRAVMDRKSSPVTPEEFARNYFAGFKGDELQTILNQLLPEAE